MLGYIDIEAANKRMIRKCTSSVEKINVDSKKLDIHLSKKFNTSNQNDMKKFLKILRKVNIDTVIFHKNVYKEYKDIIDCVYVNDINIVTGNALYINMVPNVIKYIFELSENIKLEQVHMGMAIDLLSYSKLEFIRNIADKVRGITILTTATSKFDNLCSEILSKYGLVIKCTDNFKSGLKECDVCINFDLDNSRFVNCISNKCIVVNCSKNINKMRKAFKGIIINEINIDLSDIDIGSINVKDYSSLAIAQAHNNDNMNSKISNCVGLNGEIDDKEFIDFKLYKGKK